MEDICLPDKAYKFKDADLLVPCISPCILYKLKCHRMHSFVNSLFIGLERFVYDQV